MKQRETCWDLIYAKGREPGDGAGLAVGRHRLTEGRYLQSMRTRTVDKLMRGRDDTSSSSMKLSSGWKKMCRE